VIAVVGVAPGDTIELGGGEARLERQHARRA